MLDIFYQLNRELFVEGRSFLDGNTGDIANLIVNAFIDKDGNEISPDTVKTILTPSQNRQTTETPQKNRHRQNVIKQNSPARPFQDFGTFLYFTHLHHKFLKIN